MTGSQDSCKDLYECSCRELDRMVSSCLQNGALGARLTGTSLLWSSYAPWSSRPILFSLWKGAGWGGWVLSLVSADHATNFVNRLVSDNKHLWRTASLEGSKEKAHKETTSSFVFATRASTGAFVIKLAPETSWPSHFDCLLMLLSTWSKKNPVSAGGIEGFKVEGRSSGHRRSLSLRRGNTIHHTREGQKY